MFSDRRDGMDRRQQCLPMPTGLDRRRYNCRRNRHFQSQPWWLRIKYAEELVSERALADEITALTQSQQSERNAPSSPSNKKKT